MAAYRRVYGFGHQQADCRGPVSAPEPYAHSEHGIPLYHRYAKWVYNSIYLDSIAIGVTSKDLISIAVARPGTSLLITELVTYHICQTVNQVYASISQ